MKKLVIGYDGSEQGEDAIEFGRALCDVIGAEPVLASVVPSLHPAVESLGPKDAIESRRQELLEASARRLPGREVDIKVSIQGSVGHGLTSVAESTDAVCLVIGSCHRGAVGRVALGSVGNSLIHGSPCAVAVAPRGFAVRKGAILNVGVAFDGTPEAWAALETGIGMAARAHARLAVFTVWDLSAHASATAFNTLAAGELTNADRDEKRRVLDLALTRVPEGLPVQGHLLSGVPGDVLAMASDDVDLIIIGSKSYGPIRRAFAGSVASHVLHHAHSAVMVLPRGKGIDPLGAIRPREVVESEECLEPGDPPADHEHLCRGALGRAAHRVPSATSLGRTAP
ncbi:MAG: universal stress protein, partial [Actinomycetota bacterium]|nr:universal stress protein [Actinomycetota bacterium]